MDPDASTLPLGGTLDNVKVKSYKYNLGGIYTVTHLKNGSYTFRKTDDFGANRPPVGGKRNKSRKVRRNRKRYSRKH